METTRYMLALNMSIYREIFNGVRGRDRNMPIFVVFELEHDKLGAKSVFLALACFTARSRGNFGFVLES